MVDIGGISGISGGGVATEVVAEVLVGAIGSVGRWLATAATSPRGRRAEDLSIARWFETYKLTEAVPDLPDLPPADAERLADALRGPAIQAALQELLAARLTDAPTQEAERARELFRLTLTRDLQAAKSFATRLADFYDDQICAVVARLEAGDHALLTQIRGEALSARMIAVLRAIERHTAALTSAPRDADTFLASYRRQVADHHGKLRPPDFDRRRLVPIEDIYVPGIIYEETLERTAAASQRPSSLTVWGLAARLDRTVLLGDPGGGKTTASNVLMHYFASDTARRVPFLVTLRDFAVIATPGRSVVSHIENELETFYQCPVPRGLVEMLLLTGRAVVIFDGLDELLETSQREDVASRVERFCTEYPLAPVLVTSRVVGYDQARLDERQFTCYRLGGFSDEDVAAYAHKWFALEPRTRPGEGDAFLTESGSVPDLRSNPLLLSLMCILYRGEGSLPRNRAEIYEQCATLLFRKWDARRHIHQKLRAGQLVEPALRYLAWWLFTRADTHTAVTERELVSAATEFLHGRGFESEYAAREAAREFIGFCHGRMWVFTDTGTTATGERLYSFTHRTFLEYFAAAQLAFGSDTPEKLAKTLGPRIARSEWEVVGELAVQIKDSTSTEGARRVYETLLGERRRRSTTGRSNILQFLARTLRSVDPSPQVVRWLTRQITDLALSDSADYHAHRHPLGWLMVSCDSNLAAVDEEIDSIISASVNSGSAEICRNGLLLALFLDNLTFNIMADNRPLLAPESKLAAFWRQRTRDYTERYRPRIIESAAYDQEIREGALTRCVITIEQALSTGYELNSLLTVRPIRFIAAAYTPYLLTRFFEITHCGPNARSQDIDYALVNLSAFGHYIITHPDLPWAGKLAYGQWDSVSQWDTMPSKMARSLSVDATAFLGAAATLLIATEGSNLLPSDVLDGNPSYLGKFSDLYWYIESRKTGTPDPQQLPELPVPEGFKQVFRDWAAGKVDFVAAEAGPDAG